MITSQYFNISGTASVFASNRHIASKQHCSVWTKSIANVWSQVQYDNYDLVNNSIVLNTPILSTIAIQVELRVADSQEELGTNPTNISILAGLNTEIELLASKEIELSSIYDNMDGLIDISDNIGKAGIVADNIVNVNSAADNMDNIISVKDSTTNINIVANDISNINVVAGIDDKIITVADNLDIIDNGYSIVEMNEHIDNVSNPHSVTKTQVGLGNVENISPANMPISIATLTALGDIITDIESKAPLVSPALTGTPTAPTQSAQDNSTKLATTAYVDGKMVLATAVNSTSGTSIGFTGIPSWVKRITVMFSGVSTNGTSNCQIQIGSGSIETSGYTGSCSSYPNIVSSSSGFTITALLAAPSIFNGMSIISKLDTNSYIQIGNTGSNSGNIAATSGHSKTLSGTLDRIRITTVNGTDTFDGGQINIMYEG